MGFKNFFVNEGPMYTFVLVWMTINVFLFFQSFQKYRGDRWTWLRFIVKDGLPVARGAAQVLNLNCALILLPVCRNLVNAARGAFEGKRSLRRLFDKNILFHKWCAYTICFFAAVHILAHFYNINNLTREVMLSMDSGKILKDLDTPPAVAFTSWPGVTGVIITLSLILMVTTAVDQIRRSYFELFWYTHHLFIVFYIALMLHGASGFINKQLNVDQVPYGSAGTCIPLNMGIRGSNGFITDEKFNQMRARYGIELDIQEGGMCYVSPAEKARMEANQAYLFSNIFADERTGGVFGDSIKMFCSEGAGREDAPPIYCFNQEGSATDFASIIDPSDGTEEDPSFGMERFATLNDDGSVAFMGFKVENPRLGDGIMPCCNCFGCTEPVMARGGPKTWQWVIGPLMLYLLERIYRFYMSKTRKMQVERVIRHNDKVPVMEVQITKVPTKAGQYAFLHCPKVSSLEWHPFTLTSSPELDYISFHIRLVGDWTCAFAEECGFYDDADADPRTDLPFVAIDGPFGTSSEDIYKYEVGVCVCAGIGVTPFASLLRELQHKQFSEPPLPMKTKHVYFYWICPGFDSWGWFSNLLVDFEHQCHEMGVPEFLNIRIHMSRGWSKDDAEKLYMQDDDEGETLVKDDQGRTLKSKMNFGRPNWNLEFGKLQQKHVGKKVGVFFCGPKVLSSQLHENCNKYTDETTQFYFNKENF